jgi:hypothetical protein
VQVPALLSLEIGGAVFILAGQPNLKGEVMSKTTKQSAESRKLEIVRTRPVASFKQSGIELTIWKNPAPNGDVYNTTIHNSYKDEQDDEWKETANFSPSDLAILAQLSGQAFQEIVRLKKQNRRKPEGLAPK